MSASGTGDQLYDLNKDNENEISKTIGENKAAEEEATKAASIESEASPVDEEASKSLEHDTKINDPGIDDPKSEEPPVDEGITGPECGTGTTDLHSDSKNAEVPENYIRPQVMECSKDNHDSTDPKASASEVLDHDNSSSEDLELKWDDDDDIDGQIPVPVTDDVLKLLDRELGITDRVAKPESDDQNKSIKNAMSDVKETDDVEITGNDSMENQKILDQIDDLIGDNDHTNKPVELLEHKDIEAKDIHAEEKCIKSIALTEDFTNTVLKKPVEELSNETNKNQMSDKNTITENQKSTELVDDSNVELEKAIDDTSNDAVVKETSGDDNQKSMEQIDNLTHVKMKNSVGEVSNDAFEIPRRESANVIDKNIDMTLETSSKPAVKEMDVDVALDGTQTDLPTATPVTICEKAVNDDPSKLEETENTIETRTDERQELFSPDMFAEDCNKLPIKTDIAAPVVTIETDGKIVAGIALGKTVGQVHDPKASANIQNILEEKTNEFDNIGIEIDGCQHCTDDSKMVVEDDGISKVSKDDNVMLIHAEKENQKGDDLMEIEHNETDDANRLKVSPKETDNDVSMIEVSKVSEEANSKVIDDQELDAVDVAKTISIHDDKSEVQRDVTFEENNDTNVSQIEDNDDLLDTTINPNVHHRIKKPNVMLDIPTQELSDIEAELDDDSYSELCSDTIDSEKNNEMNVDKLTADNKGNKSKLDRNEVKTDEDDLKADKIDIKESGTDVEKTIHDSEMTKKVTPPIEVDAPTPSSNIRMVPISQLMKHAEVKIDDASSNDDTPKDEVKESTPSVRIDQPKPAIENDESTSSTDLVAKSVESNESNAQKDSAQQSKSKDIEQNDAEVTPKVDEQTDVNASTTKVDEQNDAKASTSKEKDAEPSTSKLTEDVIASTSKEVLLEKLSTEAVDEIQEVTDSLGLLAESSRVMDDDEDADEDDEPEDPEVDENDDDEDFDPYDESSSQMTVDQDDSTTPPPEMHLNKPTFSKTDDSDEGTLDIVDDIECIENDLPGIDLPEDTIELPSADEAVEKDEPEIIDADEHKDKQTDKSCPPEKIINILEKVLGQSTDAQNKPSKSSGLTAVKIINYVDVGGSSSDSDDVLEVLKPDVTSVNIPKGVEVMSTCTSGPLSTSEIVSKEGEVIISGVPKPPPHKMSKLNTSEVSISVKSTPTANIIDETDDQESNEAKSEIFNLDSDDEPSSEKILSIDEAKEKVAEEIPSSDRKCVNPQCTSTTSVYHRADRTTAGFYSLSRNRAVVCDQCRLRVSERTEALISSIKDLRPLIELDMACPSQQLVEISDSESDDDTPDDDDVIGEKGAEIRTSEFDDGIVGEKGAKFLEDHLADMINETWTKYKLESRLKETEVFLMDELNKIEAGAKEIDDLLNECQKKTDAVRCDFYKDYDYRRRYQGAIVIYDTPLSSYSHTEKDVEVDEYDLQTTESRYPKRRATAPTSDPPAKKPAIPMGYLPLEQDTSETQDCPVVDQSKMDDDKDISVVKLSAESAPADLPPCGEISRPPLKPGMVAYAMRNAFGTWLKGKILEVLPKTPGLPYTQCRVKFEHKVKNSCKVLAARCLAYTEPSDVRMTIGTRIIALFKDPQNTTRRDSFYSGVVAEIPNPVNNYRYLVFFDDGYAQYVSHKDTRVVCESSSLVWQEVHPFIRDFICNYLLSYPERPMVRLHAGEKLKTEWNGKWWDSKVLQVDASIALIHFDEDNRTEWIYRGSTRLAPLYLELQAAEKAGERHRSRLPRSKAQMRSNMPCVEYTRSDEQTVSKPSEVQTHTQQQEELRRQRAVAKKSTSIPSQPPNVIQGTPFEGVISRVVYYTPKNAVKPYKMSAHTCTIKCKRTDLLSLKDLQTYNPLAKPLLSGWERQTVRYKGHKEVMYRAPCGRRLRNMPELHKYLRILQSDLSVDLFDFTPGTHCLAEFVLNKYIVGKKDLSHGKENVPVPCVNYYDDTLPEFCSYNTERTPTAGVPLNIDPDFLCGCDCTDDCVDKTKCACWKMTLEGARTIGLESPNVGYEYRRLPEPLPSGIYECNSRCKCKNTCLNRVAQHPLNLKLQVFKTINRGWGIRALNDVPKGSFLCVYAGNLLTDATANLDGLNEGDEYLAELDYIEVVEAMKEGYEDDIPDADKKLDKKALSNKSESDESESTSESEEEKEPSEKDDDFQPGYLPHTNVVFNINAFTTTRKSLRKREKAKKKEQEQQKEEARKRNDCITISDDEEVREPSRFTAQAGMVDKAFSSKHRSVRSLYGKDEACYIMDAKVKGNIGRYLNHSCQPNVFVQNVFVDTHDPRFPWVAFFALSHVRAGTELTWNYNYDVGSVPGKVLYCYCGAPNCRGRLL